MELQSFNPYPLTLLSYLSYYCETKTNYFPLVWGNWGSSVSILSDHRLDDQGSIPGEANDFFPYTLCPDHLWSPLSLLPSAHPGSFPGVKRGRGVTLTTHPHLVLRSRMRSYITSPPWRLHGGCGTVFAAVLGLRQIQSQMMCTTNSVHSLRQKPNTRCPCCLFTVLLKIAMNRPCSDDSAC
jgi:hypothetical protein